MAPPRGQDQSAMNIVNTKPFILFYFSQIRYFMARLRTARLHSLDSLKTQMTWSSTQSAVSWATRRYFTSRTWCLPQTHQDSLLCSRRLKLWTIMGKLFLLGPPGSCWSEVTALCWDTGTTRQRTGKLSLQVAGTRPGRRTLLRVFVQRLMWLYKVCTALNPQLAPCPQWHRQSQQPGLLPHRRPLEGHDHSRWGEHLPCRDRAVSAHASQSAGRAGANPNHRRAAEMRNG